MTNSTKRTVEERTEILLEGSPFSVWPTGMPASIDPELVFIGVSPGNSPMPQEHVSPECERQTPTFVSAPTAYKPSNSHFYYPDSSRYWEKLRYLAHQYFLSEDPNTTEHEAISRCSHFNLGTGDAGSATKHDVEKEVVKWVSNLLNVEQTPKLVILFGLLNILKDEEVKSWWNHSRGLKVPWSSPDKESVFKGYQKKAYRFREWLVKASNGGEVKLVMWPNHPSRVPFRDIDVWQRAVMEYVRNA